MMSRSLVDAVALLQTDSVFFFPVFFMCSSSPKRTALHLVRVGFGSALLLTGIAHYRDAANFASSVGAGLGPNWLVQLGETWGYVLPALMIVGGLLLVLNIFRNIGVWAAGLALLSIPVGLMLKSAVTGISLGDTMPPAMNAYVWILVYIFAAMGTKRKGCCGSNCAPGCSCGMPNCNCGVATMKSPVTPIAKSMPKKSAPKKTSKR